MVLGALHGRERAFADAAGVGVIDQGAIQDRADVGHEGMVQHPLAEAGRVDEAWLGVVDAEMACLGRRATVPARISRAQRGQLRLEIGGEALDLGPRALAHARRGGRRRRGCASRPPRRDRRGYASSSRPGAVGSGDCSASASAARKGAPYFSTRASPTPAISRRRWRWSTRRVTISAICSLVKRA